MQVYKKVTFLYGGRLIKAVVYGDDKKGGSGCVHLGGMCMWITRR